MTLSIKYLSRSKLYDKIIDLEATLLNPEAVEIFKASRFTRIFYFYMHANMPVFWLELENLIQAEFLQTELDSYQSILILDCSAEGLYLRDRYPEFISSLKQKLNLEKLTIFMTTQSHADHFGETAGLLAFDHFSFFFSKKRDVAEQIETVRRTSVNTGVSRKHFVCLNNALRPHRISLMAFLRRNGLSDFGHISFNPSGPVKVAKEKSMTAQIQAAMRLLPSQREILDWFSEIPTEELFLSVDESHSDEASALVNNTPWDFYALSDFSIVTESSFSREAATRFTEKTLKSILAAHPWVVVGDSFILQVVRNMGFKTFGEFIDERYDTVSDPDHRFLLVCEQIALLNRELSSNEGYLNPLAEICRFNQELLLSERFRQKLLNDYHASLARALQRCH